MHKILKKIWFSLRIHKEKRILSALCAFVVYFFLTTKNTKNHKEKILGVLCAFVVYILID